MTGFSIAVTSAFLAGVAVAGAADHTIRQKGDHTIRQKGKVFSESEITVKRGDELLFLNDDNIAHNVLSTTAGNRFDLGLLNPGELRPVKFDSVGDVKVICAIHPTMKMTVKVSQ
jgi:plastocyanin